MACETQRQDEEDAREAFLASPDDEFIRADYLRQLMRWVRCVLDADRIPGMNEARDAAFERASALLIAVQDESEHFMLQNQAAVAELPGLIAALRHATVGAAMGQAAVETAVSILDKVDEFKSA